MARRPKPSSSCARLSAAAARTPQVQENLALVLGLRGRYEEARSTGQTALSPAKADQNVAYLRELGQARSTAGAAAGPAGAPAASDPAPRERQPAATELSVGRAPAAE